jgi:formylglycine-generating enzyme required for sulfatase activity
MRQHGPDPELRVAHVHWTASPVTGGVEVHCSSLTEQLAGAGLNTRLLSGTPEADTGEYRPALDIGKKAGDAGEIALLAEELAQFELALAAAELGFAWQGEGPPDHPAAVSHWQAAAFCQWLSARTGRLVRLPSEREWERAARGSDAREFPWGDRFDPACANTRESGAGTTAPVGSFPRGASPYRVLDMAGNLDEWTITPYAPYPGAPGDVCATEDWALSPFVTRGGGFNHTRDAARCARRHGVYDDSPVGFRVVSVSGAASG